MPYPLSNIIWRNGKSFGIYMNRDIFPGGIRRNSDGLLIFLLCILDPTKMKFKACSVPDPVPLYWMVLSFKKSSLKESLNESRKYELIWH